MAREEEMKKETECAHRNVTKVFVCTDFGLITKKTTHRNMSTQTLMCTDCGKTL